MIREPFDRNTIMDSLTKIIRDSEHPILDDAGITGARDHVLITLPDGSSWLIKAQEHRAGKPWDDGDDSPES